MPTGYTADIKDGISFEKFVWSCARAFGALVMMRDDPMDAPIPREFEPSTHYAEQAENARTELARLQAMTSREISAACEASYRQALESHAKRIAEATELRAKYLRMRQQVSEWTPPTSEHEGLKKFMLEQIDQSVDFDCNTKYGTAPTKQDAQMWHVEAVERARKNVAYYEEEQRKEIERTNGRNAWLKALRESVPPAP